MVDVLCLVVRGRRELPGPCGHAEIQRKTPDALLAQVAACDGKLRRGAPPVHTLLRFGIDTAVDASPGRTHWLGAPVQMCRRASTRAARNYVATAKTREPYFPVFNVCSDEQKVPLEAKRDYDPPSEERGSRCLNVRVGDLFRPLIQRPDVQWIYMQAVGLFSEPIGINHWVTWSELWFLHPR